MAKQIWKYPLKLTTERQEVVAPGWLECRAFAMQDDKPTMWGEVVPGLADSRHTFVIVGTGRNIPADWTYRGTVQDGPYVWHLYQKPPHFP